MSYSCEKISSNQVKITFDVASEKFDEAVQKAYLKARGKINVPGFRKGKAPRKLIEGMYGENVFYEDAVDILFPEIYAEAVEGEKLEVVDRPSMNENFEQIGVGQNLKFAVTVFVKPDVELGGYKGLKGTKYIEEVTDEKIENRIEQDVEKATTTAEVTDRPVQNGDLIHLDYAGTVDGVAFDGGTAENQELEIGSGHFIPGFEDQMIGMAIGEEKDLNVTFPADYNAEELAGKAAVFHVKVLSISEKVKPELNDDFAADVSEFDTFEAYRENIVKELKDTAEKNAATELENELIQAAVDASDCDIPDAMIEDEIDAMVRQQEAQMRRYGLSLDQYLKYTSSTIEQMRDNLKPEAKNRVKMQLVLEAIIKAEAIVPNDEEIEKQFADEAERAGLTVEAFKDRLNDRQKEYLKENASIRKAVDLIVETAEVEVKDAKERIDAAQAVEAVQEAAEAISEETEE